jgi:cytochrome c-type biogenesis protein CcmH/NrfG
MAKQGGEKEHKMLFDLRGGKRGMVVKVVYAVLAVLMGLSLLLIAGPLPFGDIFGGEDATELAQEQNEERIERIEVKLAKDPEDPALLLNLTKAHLAAGSALIEEVGPEQLALTPESRQEYEQAASTWDEYLEATDEPSSGTAQQMSNTFLQLAETSTNLQDSERNIEAAAEAQKIVAEQRPSIGALGTLAIYTLFSQNFEEAKQFNEEAKKFATSKFEREQLDTQFEETEKRAKAFAKELEREERLQKAFNESQGQGEAPGGGAVQNPFGLGGATLSE